MKKYARLISALLIACMSLTTVSSAIDIPEQADIIFPEEVVIAELEGLETEICNDNDTVNSINYASTERALSPAQLTSSIDEAFADDNNFENDPNVPEDIDEDIEISPYKYGVLYQSRDTSSGILVYKEVIDDGSSHSYQEFVKYLTSAWAKAEEYTYDEKCTVKTTYTGNLQLKITKKVVLNLGLSYENTEDFSVGITLSADPNKYSKLALSTDYFIQNYWYTESVDGTITDSFGGKIKIPEDDLYIDVVYK